MSIDYGYLKLDGTEDRDDDDATTHNKLLILAVKDVENWNVCCNLSSREKSE